MRAAIFNGPRSIGVTDRPDPVIAAPTDAVVRVVLSCVCDSDLAAEHSPFRPHELATICHVRYGRRPSPHTVKRILAEGGTPALDL